MRTQATACVERWSRARARRASAGVIATVVARSDSEPCLERAGEAGRIDQSPPGCDCTDRLTGKHRILQVLAAVLQPSGLDPLADRAALCLEQLVQVAHGNGVRSGDRGRIQLRII